MRRLTFLILLAILSTLDFSIAQGGPWAPATSPEEIGKKVSNRFLESPHGIYGYGAKPHIPYFEVCTWYGALTFAKETKDKELLTKLENRFTVLTEKESHLYPKPDHVDYNVFGAMVLELYLQTKHEKYHGIGVSYADTQWNVPSDSSLTDKAKQYVKDGYSWQTRLWIDDMYMITMAQAQAFRVTNDKKYIDRAAKEMVLYLDKLQQPNGLFYHAPNSPFYWGRGNGWMAAGMTELLRVLPADNPDRPRILDGYKKMMNTLLSFQAESGMWRQLINDAESWPETSSTGMFTFAMITGTKNGWLDDKTFGPAARKGWLGLISYLDGNGDLREVCEGTGAGNNRQYYLDRKRNIGDFHGQAPVLWCATAWLRK